MNLVAQIKLLTTPEQAAALLQTMRVFNAACNWLAARAYETKQFSHFKLQKANYYELKDRFGVSGHNVCLICSKVGGSFNSIKAPCDTLRFEELGATVYDLHTLSFQMEYNTVSMWSTTKRQKGIRFVCGNHQRRLLEFPKKQTDLIYRKGKFYLHITVSVPDVVPIPFCDVIGVDAGIVNLARDSDGNTYGGAHLMALRCRNHEIKRRLQRIGSKSAKRLLRKRGGRIRRFSTNVNHTISKRIVHLAERTGRGIALEDLGNIQGRVTVRKCQLFALNTWSFGQLRDFIEYKAKRVGVPVVTIDPAHTSQRCSECGHTAKNNRRSRDLFVCRVCGFTDNADGNGAKNVRLKGLAELARLRSFSHTRRPLAMPTYIAVPSCKSDEKDR